VMGTPVQEGKSVVLRDVTPAPAPVHASYR